MPESSSAVTETSVRQLIGVAVLIAALSVDLTPVRFSEVAASRWIVLGALALAGIYAARTLDRLSTAERLLFATFGWVLVVAPLSPTPLRSAVVAAALAGTVALGVWIGRHVSWENIQSAAVAGLTGILAIAVVLGDRGSDDGRWLGLSEEANALGEVAAIAVVFGAAALVRRNVLAAPAVLLGVLVLFQTAATIPSFAAFVGVMVVLRPLLANVSPALSRNLAAALVGIPVVGLALVAWLGTGAVGPESDSLTTLNRRTGIWSFLYEQILERPFTGYGPWSAGDLMSAAPFDARVTWGPTHGHNVFVELATMGGLPAAGLFLAAIAVTGWALVRSGHPAGAVAVTLLAMSMTEHLVATPSLALVLIGMIAGPSGAAKASALNRTLQSLSPTRR